MAHGRHSTSLRFKDVQRALQQLGLTITRDTVGSGPTGSGEYCVKLSSKCWNLPSPRTAADSAFYTPDLADALATGRKMAEVARNAGWGR